MRKYKRTRDQLIALLPALVSGERLNSETARFLGFTCERPMEKGEAWQGFASKSADLGVVDKNHLEHALLNEVLTILNATPGQSAARLFTLRALKTWNEVFCWLHDPTFLKEKLGTENAEKILTSLKQSEMAHDRHVVIERPDPEGDAHRATYANIRLDVILACSAIIIVALYLFLRRQFF